MFKSLNCSSLILFDCYICLNEIKNMTSVYDFATKNPQNFLPAYLRHMLFIYLKQSSIFKGNPVLKKK